MKRVAVALAIAAGIYGLALGVGSALYATGAIATGATHNDCADYKKELAEARGVDEEDVPQRDIERETEACLREHELTEEEAYRTEFLFWSAWPAVITAAIFLAWPWWANILLRQEEADPVTEASHLEQGT